MTETRKLDINPVGNLPEKPVQDEGSASLLNQILKELKIMNTHLGSITDEKILKEDIDG